MRPVLLVDDDLRLGEMLRDFLAHHGLALSICHDGMQGLKAAKTGQYDLMLLDVTMSGIDGFEVLRVLRTFSDLRVLLLTARGEAADRVRGLQLGADDYLPKPFNAEELAARIHAILRRSSERSSAAPDLPVKPRLERAGLALDFASRTVSYRETVLDLTEIETSLLEMFLENPGVVLTREALVLRVFRRPFHPLDRSLDVYVSRLRRKLQDSTPFDNHIKTVRSCGYLFSAAGANTLFAQPTL